MDIAAVIASRTFRTSRALPAQFLELLKAFVGQSALARDLARR